MVGTITIIGIYNNDYADTKNTLRGAVFVGCLSNQEGSYGMRITCHAISI